MKSIAAIRSIVLAALACASASAGDSGVTVPLLPTDPPASEIDRAKSIIEQWENQQPEKGERVLRIVYWTPADRDPQPEFRARLTRVMKHIQEFYDNQMAGYGFTGRTIRLEFEKDGMLRIPVAKGTLKAADCSEADHSDGQAIRRDCLRELAKSGINGEKETLVIFCNLTTWDPEKRTMSHNSPYYASGIHSSGTAWQVDSCLLDSANLGVKDQFLTDKQYGRISLGKYNSIFVGGVCHELGHALGMPHCRECAHSQATRGTALMGSGNRTYGEDLRNESKGSFLTLPHALKLAVHPQFSGSVKQMETPAKVSYSQLKLSSQPDGLNIRGKVDANLPCHAVLAYADPEGGADYDSAISVGVPRGDGSFELTIPLSGTRSKPALLSLVAVCVNGAATAGVWSAQGYNLPLRVDAQGLYDPQPAMATIEVTRYAESVRKGIPLPLALLDTLTPVSRECLGRLRNANSFDGKKTPANKPDAIRSLALSDAKPDVATTGYGGVHVDRSDAGQPLISSDGPAAHGLWAHANSKFEYDLGGKWRTFSGKCGLLNTGGGPIRATISLDGKPVWNSGEIKDGGLKRFSVRVADASKLTLEIQGVKGIGSTHGAWLEPTLSR